MQFLVHVWIQIRNQDTKMIYKNSIDFYPDFLSIKEIHRSPLTRSPHSYLTIASNWSLDPTNLTPEILILTSG